MYLSPGGSNDRVSFLSAHTQYLPLLAGSLQLTTLCRLLFSQQMLQRKRDSFGELLQAASTIGDLRNCPVGLTLSPIILLSLKF